MGFVYLFLVITLLTTQNVVRKAYTTKHNGIYIFNAISAFSAMLVFFITAGGKLNFRIELLPYSLIFAAFFATCIVSMLKAIQVGSLTLSSLISSYSLIIPTLFGLIFLSETTGNFFYPGIALLLISLFLVNYEKGEKKITVKWIIFVTLMFFSNGLCSTVQKIQQIDFNKQYKSEFMFIVYLIVTLTMLLLALKNEHEIIKPCITKASIHPIICGVANGLTNYLVMVLVGLMPTSLVFPLISAGGLIATAIISRTVYKERFSKPQLIGIILGTASIVLLNI